MMESLFNVGKVDKILEVMLVHEMYAPLGSRTEHLVSEGSFGKSLQFFHWKRSVSSSFGKTEDSFFESLLLLDFSVVMNPVLPLGFIDSELKF